MAQSKYTPNTSCQRCGDPFHAPLRRLAKGRGKYCSRECRLAALHEGNRGQGSSQWKPKVTLICEWCDKPFEVNPNYVGHRKHCSKDCDSEHRRAVTGANHPLHKPRVRMSCEVCGAICMVKPSLVSRFRACSRRCAAALSQDIRTSSLETATKAVLDLLGEPYEQQAAFKWYRVDFYLPCRNLVIECDGTYWHSLPNQQRIDKAKDTYFRNHGIALVRIAEDVIRSNVWGAVQEVLHANPPLPANPPMG